MEKAPAGATENGHTVFTGFLSPLPGLDLSADWKPTVSPWATIVRCSAAKTRLRLELFHRLDAAAGVIYSGQNFWRAQSQNCETKFHNRGLHFDPFIACQQIVGSTRFT